MDIRIIGLDLLYKRNFTNSTSTNKRLLTQSSKLNPLSINSTNIDIYIIPSPYNTNYTSLNFTWVLQEINRDMLQIQLNFTNASQISPHIDQDTLVFHAKEAVFGQELILKSKIKP